MPIVDQSAQYENYDYLAMGWNFTNICDLLPYSITLKPSPGGNGLTARSVRIDTAGKLMGLSSYGNYNSVESYKLFEWYMREIFPEMHVDEKEFKDGKMQGNFNWPGIRLLKYFKGRHKDAFPLTLEDEIQIAWEIQEIARISVTKTFEDQILPTAEKYNNNIVIGGGCGMNVVINQMIRDKWPHLNLFVPSNPGDAGLAIGVLSEYLRDKIPTVKTPHLSDTRLMDIEDVPKVLEDRNAKVIDTEDFSEILNDGGIVGFIDGGIEIGARSLCRRSIIASATFPNMKDKINSKVKNREWYRPFAPVTRDIDVQDYFYGPYKNLESMNYALKTRESWQKTLVAINHVDNTARVQALTPEESPKIYELLNHMGPPVVLNTSFNIGGKPILNTIKEALWMLDNTDLDHLIIVHEDQLWKIDKELSDVRIQDKIS